MIRKNLQVVIILKLDNNPELYNRPYVTEELLIPDGKIKEVIINLH